MAGARDRSGRAVLRALDRLLFGFAGVASVWLAYLLLVAGLQPGWRMLLVVVFWGLVAYLALPRLHRVLTYLYLPDYFIGRSRTSDGLLGDPVNLAMLGDEAQLHQAMRAAGWVRADDVSVASGVRIVTATLSRRSYAEAPVSPLNLWGRPQDFAYQQEVAGSPMQRHHVRFWHCPEGWLLPGGFAVDWLAAGTYDTSVGLSLWTFQVTHRIAQDVDTERDHVVSTLTSADEAVAVRVIDNFSTGYHSRNGGGDRIETDGDLPVVDLRAVHAPTPQAPVPVTDSRRRRPAPTVFGSSVAALRGLYFLAGMLLLLVAPGSTPVPSRMVAPTAVLVAVYAVAGLLDLVLAAATYVGRNWARVVLNLESAIAIVEAIALEERSGLRPSLGHSLPAVGLSILVLLALTSTRSRVYAAGAADLPTRQPASAVAG